MKTIWKKTENINGTNFDFIYSFDPSRDEYILESFKGSKKLFFHTIPSDTVEMIDNDPEHWGNHFLKDAVRLIREKILEKSN